MNRRQQTPPPASFAQAIQNARVNGTDLGRERFARAIDRSTSTVTAWERGHLQPPEPETVIRIAEVLNVNAHNLMGMAIRERAELVVPAKTIARVKAAVAIGLVWSKASDEQLAKLEALALTFR